MKRIACRRYSGAGTRTVVFAVLLLVSADIRASAQEPAANVRQITAIVDNHDCQPLRCALPEGATTLDALKAAHMINSEGTDAIAPDVRLLGTTAQGKPFVKLLNVKKIVAGQEVPTPLRDGDTLDLSDEPF